MQKNDISDCSIARFLLVIIVLLVGYITPRTRVSSTRGITQNHAESIGPIVTPNEYFNVKPVQRDFVDNRALTYSTAAY